MHRRLLLSAGLACAAFGTIPLFSAAARANDSPARLVVPFPPGGGGDVLARSVSQEFGAAFGRKILIENRPGAGGTVGARFASNLPADGNSLLYVTNGILCVNPLLYANIPFDPLVSLAPVGQISSIGLMAVLNPNAIAGVNDLESLLKYAKANPDVVDYASSGNGTTSHLAGCFLAERTGLKLSHVPYRGGAAAILDVLAGRVPLMIDVAPNVIHHVRAGKLAALGVASATRLGIAPEVPTFAELGIDGFELAAWDGVMAPAGTPESVLEKMSVALQRALKEKSVVDRLRTKGAEPASGERSDFSAFIGKERPKWASLVKQIGAKTD